MRRLPKHLAPDVPYRLAGPVTPETWHDCYAVPCEGCSATQGESCRSVFTDADIEPHGCRILAFRHRVLMEDTLGQFVEIRPPENEWTARENARREFQ